MKKSLKFLGIIGLSSLMLAGCGHQSQENHASSQQETSSKSTHHKKKTAKKAARQTASAKDSTFTANVSNSQTMSNSSSETSSSVSQAADQTPGTNQNASQTAGSSARQSTAINSVQDAMAAVDAKYGNGDIQWSYMSEGNSTMATDANGQPVYWIRGQDSAYRNAHNTAGSYDGHDYYVYPDGRIVPRE
ncbi:hypothetical protein ACLUWI_08585 [Limosilactobacillus mucosae]|uniref:hypothetical protein n=1 Tax=Limosilactobacillus mucosae TaxID=97478 RepID=UPI0039927E47